MAYCDHWLVSQVWGAEVHGVDVKQDLSMSTINTIKEAVTQYVVTFACLQNMQAMKRHNQGDAFCTLQASGSGFQRSRCD